MCLAFCRVTCCNFNEDDFGSVLLWQIRYKIHVYLMENYRTFLQYAPVIHNTLKHLNHIEFIAFVAQHAVPLGVIIEHKY